MARLFVLDPVCAFEYGHNLSSLRYFRDFLTTLRSFSSVHCLACRLLTGEHLDIDRHFCYYYEKVMPTGNSSHLQESSYFSARAYSAWLEEASMDDVQRFFSTYSPEADDCIFFPSIDFYAGKAFLRFIESIDPEALPRVHMRFIGVMEGQSPFYSNGLEVVVDALKQSRHRNALFLSAEAPNYASHLAAWLGTPVFVTPYPMMCDLEPLSRSVPFTLSFPGSARLDKGFLHISAVVSKFIDLLDQAHEVQRFRVLVQQLRNDDAVRHCGYTSRLGALPGVHLLPSSIPPKQMMEMLRNSHVLALPYDRATYAMRGSAMLMEAIALGRPVVTYDGLGFSSQVEYYQAGHVVSSPDEMASALYKVLKSPRSLLENGSLQSRSRLEVDVHAIYRRWLQ